MKLLLCSTFFCPGLCPPSWQRLLPPEAAEARPGRRRDRLRCRNQMGRPPAPGKTRTRYLNFEVP